ncbi:MAG: helicase-exonuclease AddAB subunit AddA [Heliobacteriaceae bacterium]|nr:helicase-exonuclease AddAB subunit AddA [Heliobacteriaceae bacterium]
MVGETKKWTASQWQAITTRGCDILVAAGAGAGKTAVLVERVVQLVHQGADVDRLLVVTFTNAAAAEMRDRVRTALAKALTADPANSHLNRQLLLVNRASIMTLHSFCLDILRRHYYRIDLDPGFRVADETEIALLRQDVLDQVFEAGYEGNGAQGAAFIRLVDALAGDRDDGSLRETVLDLYHRARSQPWPEAWLEAAVKAFQGGGESTEGELVWLVGLREDLMPDLDGAAGQLAQALRLCGVPGGPGAYIEALQEDSRQVADLIGAAKHSWDRLYQCFQTLAFPKLKVIRGDVDQAVKAQVQSLRDGVKKQLRGLKESYFTREPAALAADCRQVLPLVTTLVELVKEFSREFQQAKREKRLVDFGDLEHYCLQILLAPGAGPDHLAGSVVAGELAANFQEVLVDEYQDINPVQETILVLLSRGNRFMVGDVKQSIYRFRLAEPALFTAKYREFSVLGPTEPAGTGVRIDLARNFRSRNNIIDGVNFIFRQLMTARVAEVAYDDRAELVFGAGYPAELADPPLELHIIDRGDAPEQDEGPDLETACLEARLICRRIREMAPVRFADIVVLMRATKGQANVFLEEFRLAGIPVHAETETGYFEATEIAVMLALLQVIDNPRQDIPLVATLRSPLFRFTAAELAQIRLADRQGCFFTAVQAFVAAGGGDATGQVLAERLAGFLKQLEQWRNSARRESLAWLIWQVGRDTGFYDYVGGMPGGSQRRANLRALYDRARQFEGTSYRGLFRFLRFVERLQERGGDLGPARALGEKENVVRIMSIHKSKGLEFPVVFVAGLGRQFNLTDTRQRLLVHKDLGLGPVVVDPVHRYYYPTIARQAIQRRLIRESLAEEMRILYVALTRAREKLVLVGTVKELTSLARKWEPVSEWPETALPDYLLVKAKTGLDWLGPALIRHPAGQALRGGQPPATGAIGDPSRWEVRVWSGAEFSQPETGLGTDKHPCREWLAGVQNLEPVCPVEPVAGLLAWEYPFAALAGIPAKVTVTQVKAPLAGPVTGGGDEMWSLRPPRFLTAEQPLKAAERGTAVHIVMRHLNLATAGSVAGIQQQINSLVERELLTPVQAEAVRPEEIQGFLAHPLGRRLARAGQVLRERPFSLAVPQVGGESLVLQGVVDCLFLAEQGWVLLDYKTDRLPPGTTPAEWLPVVAANYRDQVAWYQRAVQTCLAAPVVERYLYLFAVGQAVAV